MFKDRIVESLQQIRFFLNSYDSTITKILHFCLNSHTFHAIPYDNLSQFWKCVASINCSLYLGFYDIFYLNIFHANINES